MAKKEKGKIKITHNKKLFVAIIVLFVLLIALLVVIKIREQEERAGEAGECKVDEDCVKQQVTCCSCNMGGIRECMTKQNASYWQNKLGECEQGLLCMALYNCQDTSCRCKENKCVEE